MEPINHPFRKENQGVFPTGLIHPNAGLSRRISEPTKQYFPDRIQWSTSR